MDRTLIDLYHRHVGMAFDRQMRLAEFLERKAGGADWDYTVSTATLTFGKEVKFEALLLGSHADPDNSWLWAWANRHMQLTPANRALADRVRQHAVLTGVSAFAADRQVSCEDLLGEEVAGDASHVFAAVVAGELGYDAYYTIPFDTGRAAAVIRDDRLKTTEANPLARVVSVFPQAIGAFPVPDHKAALTAYLEAYGFKPKATAKQLRVVVDGADVLTATFDKRNRLTELAGTLGPGT